MTPLTRQDVLAHQAEVPWPVPHQVEQDLLLCRAMVALFNEPFLKGQIAMRGGTVLHKVYLAPASRYSEDIDLVAVGDRPEEHLHAAIRRVLLDVLGKRKRWGWEELKLCAVRHHDRRSRSPRPTRATLKFRQERSGKVQAPENWADLARARAQAQVAGR